MDTDDTIDLLKRASKCSELAQLTTFRGYRTDERGGEREVTIRLYDAGPDPAVAHIRYAVVAEDEEGRLATGNEAPTIDQAINDVHWDALDRAP